MRRRCPHLFSRAVHLWRYPMLKVRNSGGKEIPLIQGKEQRLCFAGAAVKRYPHVQGKRNPSKMVGVARGHQRADNWNHTHRKLVNLITLAPQSCLTQQNQAMPVGQPKTGGSWWRGLTERGPLEKGMASHFSIVALRTPWTVWKGNMIDTKRGTPRSLGAQYVTGDQSRNKYRKNKGMEPKQKQYPAVDVTGERSKIRCCKSNIA